MKNKVCSVYKMTKWPIIDTPRGYEICGKPAFWENDSGQLFCAECMLTFSKRGEKFKNLNDN